MDGTADDFMTLARRSALLMTVGHGTVDQIEVGEDEVVTTTDITGIGGLTNIPVLLALHLNCHAGDFAEAMQQQCGADCTVGWYDWVPIFGTRAFSNHFWDQLCNHGNSVGGACLVAADWAYADAPRTAWYNYSIFGATSGGAGVFPARFGVAP